MSIAASIVITFGEDADDSAICVAELDDSLNVDDAGDEITDFEPGDLVFFLLHYDSSLLSIGSVRCTHGQIVKQNTVTRSRDQEAYFSDSDDTVDLDYVPKGSISAEWYGNAPTGLKKSSGEMTVSGGDFPCLGLLTYNISAQGYKLITPSVELDDDEDYTIRVEIIMEAA